MIFQTGETAKSSFWGNLTQSELRAGSGAGVGVWWGNARCISGATWGHLHQVGHIARIFCVYLRQVKHNQLSVGWKWFIYKNIEIQPFMSHVSLHLSGNQFDWWSVDSIAESFFAVGQITDVQTTWIDWDLLERYSCLVSNVHDLTQCSV